MYITTQTQLQPHSLAFLTPNHPLHPLTNTNYMPQPIRRPGEQLIQLGVAPAGLGFAKVQCETEWQGRVVTPEGLVGVEYGREGGGKRDRGVAAEVEAYDFGTVSAVGAGGGGEVFDEGEGGERGGGGVAAVDLGKVRSPAFNRKAGKKGGTYRQNQIRPQLGLGRGRLAALILGDGVEYGLDVVGSRQARGGHDAGRGAQLEVDDAVGGEVAEDREGRVAQGGGVVDEVVDVRGEEGEEAGAFQLSSSLLIGWIYRVSRSRLQVIVVFPRGHLEQRVSEIGLARFVLHEPDVVQTLSADAAAEMGMELFERQ